MAKNTTTPVVALSMIGRKWLLSLGILLSGSTSRTWTALACYTMRTSEMDNLPDLLGVLVAGLFLVAMMINDDMGDW